MGWAEEFLNSPQHPMTEECGKIFTVCCLCEGDPQFPEPEVLASFPYRLITSRAARLDLSMTPALVAFLSTLVGSPGAVMYLAALKYVAVKEKMAGPFGMEELAHTFKMGFLDEVRLSSMWDAQKGSEAGFPEMDNLLDVLTGVMVVPV